MSPVILQQCASQHYLQNSFVAVLGQAPRADQFCRMSDSEWSARGHVSDASSGFSGRGVCRASSGPPAAKRRRRTFKELPTASEAAICVFVIADSWLHMTSRMEAVWAKSVDAQPHYDGDILAIVGVVFLSWAFKRVLEDFSTEDMKSLGSQETQRKRRARIIGFIEYTCNNQCYPLDDIIHISDRDELSDTRLMAAEYSASLQHASCYGRRFSEILRNASRPIDCITIAPGLAELLMKGHTTSVQCGAITSRLDDTKLMHDFPSVKLLKAFTRLHNARRMITNAPKLSLRPLIVFLHLFEGILFSRLQMRRHKTN